MRSLLSLPLVVLALATTVRGDYSFQTPGDIECLASANSCCSGATVDIDLDYPSIDITINEASPCGGTINYNTTVRNNDCIQSAVEVKCECDPVVKKYLKITPTVDWADVENCTEMPISCGTCH